MSKKIILSAFTGALILYSGMVLATDAAPQSKDQPAPQQTTGRQLMTPEEQNEHRNKMRNAASADERKAIRKEHHEKMKAKAKEKNMAIPENPPSPPLHRGRQNGGMGMEGGR